MHSVIGPSFSPPLTAPPLHKNTLVLILTSERTRILSMKLSSITLFSLAAIAPSANAGDDVDFAKVRILIDGLERNNKELRRDLASRDIEINYLRSQVDHFRTDPPPTPSPTAPAIEDDTGLPVTQGPITPAAKDSTTPSPTPTPTVSAVEDPPTPSPLPILTPSPTSIPVKASASSESWKHNGWNYNLANPVDTGVDVEAFFIDMDHAVNTISELHEKGKWVCCYISVGTVESWRDDANDFPSAAVGNSWDDWQGERFLDINNEGVRNLMEARVEKAVGLGCDAVEPDNMMNYAENNTGFHISEDDQIEYNKWFANVVHANGMLVGMKNAVGLVPVLKGYYDFALNEECHQWNDCDVYTDAFLSVGKPVFNVEYDNSMDVCEESNNQGLDTIIKNSNLKAALCSCVEVSRSVDCGDII